MQTNVNKFPSRKIRGPSFFFKRVAIVLPVNRFYRNTYAVNRYRKKKKMKSLVMGRVR